MDAYQQGRDAVGLPRLHAAHGSFDFASSLPSSGGLAAGLRRGISLGRWHLLGLQKEDGFWQGELEGDSILQSETILILAFFGREQSAIAQRLAKRLLETQTAEGGWSQYPGGPVDISATVKAYFALKLTGCSAGSEALERAARVILSLGGAESVNSFTRFYLAFLSQIPYSVCPAVPPEIVLLPKWFPINLYSMSAWSRAMVVALSVLWALKPVRHLPPEKGIRELFLTDPKDWPLTRGSGAQPRGDLWARFFGWVDSGIKTAEKIGILPLRKKALRAAERWMLEHLEGSDGIGAIYPPMVWSLIALHGLGHTIDSPVLRRCWRHVEELILESEDGESARVQPCLSPVWDTALAARSLVAAGIPADHPRLKRALDWLVKRQIVQPGDWAATVRAEPGGWCFEHANPFYPDCDDTAAVLMALASRFGEHSSKAEEVFPPHWDVIAGQRSRGLPRGVNGQETDSLGRLWDQTALDDEANRTPEEDILVRTTSAIDRGVRWLLAMQNRDGGWAAFDRNNCRAILTRVPFADHNAMIDPSAPDLTGRVLEALGTLGYRLGHPAVDRAVAYLRRVQQPDGSWFGRWAVNYIYGTWLAVTGLRAVGSSEDDPAIVAAANWFLRHQLGDGGWGETPATYENPALRGSGPSTPSQTAWAVLGLIAAGKGRDPAACRGIRYLLHHQSPDGGWKENAVTGTGFPKVFYLRYHLYPVYFPLLALARFMLINADRLDKLDLPELSVVAGAEQQAAAEFRIA